MKAGPLAPDRMPPRRFWLVRHDEVAGVGGRGIVAEGSVWSSGQVALHWPGRPLATSVWASLDELLAVHGYDGWTMVEWIDNGDDRHCLHEYAECVEYDGGAIWIH
jgi:hypothetical protein